MESEGAESKRSIAQKTIIVLFEESVLELERWDTAYVYCGSDDVGSLDPLTVLIEIGPSARPFP